MVIGQLPLNLVNKGYDLSIYDIKWWYIKSGKNSLAYVMESPIISRAFTIVKKYILCYYLMEYDIKGEMNLCVDSQDMSG